MVLTHDLTLQDELINLFENTPKIMVGNLVDSHDSLSPPFYISLEH